MSLLFILFYSSS